MNKKVLVSAHNPMTGPRNLAHLICINDYVSEQDEYDSFYVVDDLAAYVMYPASRTKVLNRAFFTIRDFLAAGVDPKRSNLVLTSMLPEVLELNLLFNMHVDLSFCTMLYKESFCGTLLSFQRQQVGFNKYPSVTEVVYTQTALAALTLGLGTRVFTGGEEMLGYLPIMEEIVKNFNEAYGPTLTMPKMDLVKHPFVLGNDGRHMMTDNAVFLSAPIDETSRAVESVSDYRVLDQWYDALGQREKAKDMPRSGTPSNEHKRAASQLIVELLKPFRDFVISNDEILEIARGGAAKAKGLLNDSVLSVRGAIGMPPNS